MSKPNPPETRTHAVPRNAVRTQAIEDYLKAIYLVGGDGQASTSDVAERLGVSQASVTGMLKKLSELKLIRYESYKGAELMHAGRLIALEVLRHHRLIETYLTEALGYAWEDVHDEAERLEHHISEEFEDRIASLLGDPKYDPHGDPIPTKDGHIPPVSQRRLADAQVGSVVTVRRVRTDDRETLRYLRTHHIMIGSSIRILGRADHDDLTLQSGRQRLTLPYHICCQIYIDESIDENIDE